MSRSTSHRVMIPDCLISVYPCVPNARQHAMYHRRAADRRFIVQLTSDISARLSGRSYERTDYYAFCASIGCARAISEKKKKGGKIHAAGIHRVLSRAREIAGASRQRFYRCNTIYIQRATRRYVKINSTTAAGKYK